MSLVDVKDNIIQKSFALEKCNKEVNIRIIQRMELKWQWIGLAQGLLQVSSSCKYRDMDQAVHFLNGSPLSPIQFNSKCVSIQICICIFLIIIVLNVLISA